MSTTWYSYQVLVVPGTGTELLARHETVHCTKRQKDYNTIDDSKAIIN